MNCPILIEQCELADERVNWKRRIGGQAHALLSQLFVRKRPDRAAIRFPLLLEKGWEGAGARCNCALH